MITIFTMEWNNYEGRAAEYIDKLERAVSRNMTEPYKFVALRLDASPFKGWWKKLEAFRPGRFRGRCLYIDLDSLIVGPLEQLAANKGAVHLRDWGWARNVHCGTCWVFDAEIEGAMIWKAWRPELAERYADDQEWLTELNVFGRLPVGLVASYRYHCRQQIGPPPGASVIAFHGRPKPHEIAVDWVQSAWS